MKLRLTQPGFENYSGQMGVLNFVEGLSTTGVRAIDAVRMAAVMNCEWEDGSSPNVAQSLLDNANTPAPMFVSGEAGQHDLESQTAADLDAEEKRVAGGDIPKTSDAWTEERLAIVADKDGIKGLREIADPLGIKGNSIRDLIVAIVKKQGA